MADQESNPAEVKFYSGDMVKAKKFGSFEHDFEGRVEKVYENSIMIEITKFNPKDQLVVGELNNRAVVRQDSVTVTKAAPRPAVEAEDEEKK